MSMDVVVFVMFCFWLFMLVVFFVGVFFAYIIARDVIRDELKRGGGLK